MAKKMNFLASDPAEDVIHAADQTGRKTANDAEADSPRS